MSAATRDNQQFDLASNSSWTCSTTPGAVTSSTVFGGKKKQVQKNSMIFEKAGTIMTTYGYSFGDQLWEFKIHYQSMN